VNRRPASPEPADSTPFRLHIESDPYAVGEALSALADSLCRSGASAALIQSVEIVVAEVLNNIMEHAYRNLPGHPIDIELSRNADGWRLRFTDRGRPMPGEILPEGRHQDLDVCRAHLPEGGFGWMMIRELAGSLHYRREGGRNLLELVLPSAESPCRCRTPGIRFEDGG